MIAQRGVRTRSVEVGDPGGDLGACVVEVEEQRLVEQFVSHAAVEAFHEAVLHWLAWRHELPVDAIILTLALLWQIFRVRHRFGIPAARFA